MTNETDIFAPVRNLGEGDALESWRWLIGKSATVKLLTAMGDLFFVKPRGLLRQESVFFLDTCEGTAELASESWAEFRDIIKSMKNVPGHWFKYSLLVELSDKRLRDGECYSPDHPPILGGSYEKSNFRPISWEVHVDFMGQIHKQVIDLPAGTPVNTISLELPRD